MRQLATEFWDKNADDDQNKKAVSRVRWIIKQCEDYYFSGGMHDAFERENSLCSKYNITTNTTTQSRISVTERLKVLDVGSCYNPFHKFPRFDVIAVDIAPASSDVHQCDFLNLKILDDSITPMNPCGKISELTAASFDVVVFSLLLEYLPSSKQRYSCCSKASRLLTPGGILCIVTPDSKHATANAQIFKKWKYALANEGLLRIQYDKLPHLHCMVFRKCINSTLPHHWLSKSLETEIKRGKPVLDQPHQLMVIPQDFQSHKESNEGNGTADARDNDETVASIFADLPDYDM